MDPGELHRIRLLLQQLVGKTFPPFGINAYWRDLMSRATLGANTVLMTTPVASEGDPFSFDVPSGRVGLINRLGLSLSSPAGLAFVRFRIAQDGTGVLNYQAPPVLIGTVDLPTEIFVELKSGMNVALQFTNSDPATAYVVTARWQYWLFDPHFNLAEPA